MSRIQLRRRHDLTAKVARQKVDRMAAALAKRFEAECQWKGNVLSIEHSSVTGKVVVGKDEIVVDAKLGFLLAMFRDRVDDELTQILDAEFPEEKA
jgi:putative polyhydroxyalkanoate system protein